MRLIDADRLKRVLIAFFTGLHLELPHISKVIDFLDNAPTVDAVPVVHGEWIWTESGDHDYEQYWVCDKCGEKQYIETKYCPDCGAKMDGND